MCQNKRKLSETLKALPDRITLKGEQVQMTGDEFFSFCQANAGLNIYRSEKYVWERRSFDAVLSAGDILPSFALQLAKLKIS